MSAAVNPQKPTSGRGMTSLVSFLGRANYNLMINICLLPLSAEMVPVSLRLVINGRTLLQGLLPGEHQKNSLLKI